MGEGGRAAPLSSACARCARGALALRALSCKPKLAGDTGAERCTGWKLACHHHCAISWRVQGRAAGW